MEFRVGLEKRVIWATGDEKKRFRSIFSRTYGKWWFANERKQTELIASMHRWRVIDSTNQSLFFFFIVLKSTSKLIETVSATAERYWSNFCLWGVFWGALAAGSTNNLLKTVPNRFSAHDFRMKYERTNILTNNSSSLLETFYLQLKSRHWDKWWKDDSDVKRSSIQWHKMEGFTSSSLRRDHSF